MRNLTVLATLAIGLLLTARDTQAARPQEAGGTFLVDSIVPISVEQFGNFSFVELVAVFSLDGTVLRSTGSRESAASIRDGSTGFAEIVRQWL